MYLITNIDIQYQIICNMAYARGNTSMYKGSNSKSLRFPFNFFLSDIFFIEFLLIPISLLESISYFVLSSLDKNLSTLFCV